jgi:hypothetical protein
MKVFSSLADLHLSNINLIDTETGNGTLPFNYKNIINFVATIGDVIIEDSIFEDFSGVGVSFIAEGLNFETKNLTLNHLQIYFSFPNRIRVIGSTFYVSPISDYYGFFDVNHFSIHDNEKNSNFTIENSYFYPSKFINLRSNVGFSYFLRTDFLLFKDSHVENLIFVSNSGIENSEPAIVAYGNAIILNTKIIRCQFSNFIQIFTTSQQVNKTSVVLVASYLTFDNNTVAVCNFFF